MVLQSGSSSFSRAMTQRAPNKGPARDWNHFLTVAKPPRQQLRAGHQACDNILMCFPIVEALSCVLCMCTAAYVHGKTHTHTHTHTHCSQAFTLIHTHTLLKSLSHLLSHILTHTPCDHQCVYEDPLCGDLRSGLGRSQPHPHTPSAK